MAKLNEIRTSNLQHLKSLSYVEAAKEFPKDLLRLLYKMFEDAGIKTDTQEKTEIINRFDRDLEDGGPASNWWLDTYNNRDFQINKDVSIYISTERGKVEFRVTSYIISRITFKFNYEKKIGEIFDKIVNFAKEALEKTKDSKGIKDYENIRQELKQKYATNESRPKFVKSIEKICKKYGYEFGERGSRDLSYEINYSEELNEKLSYLDGQKLKHAQTSIMRKKIFPYIIKKIESSNYLIKEFRPLDNFILLELTNKGPDNKMAGKNVTYEKNHERQKDKMMGEFDQISNRDIIKDILGG